MNIQELSQSLPPELPYKLRLEYQENAQTIKVFVHKEDENLVKVVVGESEPVYMHANLVDEKHYNEDIAKARAQKALKATGYPKLKSAAPAKVICVLCKNQRQAVAGMRLLISRNWISYRDAKISLCLEHAEKYKGDVKYLLNATQK